MNKSRVSFEYEKNKSEAKSVTFGEFESTAKCEHRI